jgi:hypothetical protein
MAPAGLDGTGQMRAQNFVSHSKDVNEALIVLCVIYYIIICTGSRTLNKGAKTKFSANIIMYCTNHKVTRMDLDDLIQFQKKQKENKK